MGPQPRLPLSLRVTSVNRSAARGRGKSQFPPAASSSSRTYCAAAGCGSGRGDGRTGVPGSSVSNGGRAWKAHSLCQGTGGERGFALPPRDTGNIVGIKLNISSFLLSVARLPTTYSNQCRQIVSICLQTKDEKSKILSIVFNIYKGEHFDPCMKRTDNL